MTKCPRCGNYHLDMSDDHCWLCGLEFKKKKPIWSVS